ncbi:MAG: chemotaxis protein, partial [Methylobacterium sp.]|nr:chemotaxis protein [Methylobacterium sp.]
MSIHAIQKTIEFIKQAAGIVLTPEKAYFVEARLAPVLREENIAGLDDLLRRVETGDRRLQQRIIDALTTN